MVAVEQMTLDYVFNQLLINLFGSPTITGLFILLVAIIFCMSNGFDLQTMFIMIIPIIIGTIVAGFLPTVMWSVIIFTICFLWIFVAWKIVGMIT